MRTMKLQYIPIASIFSIIAVLNCSCCEGQNSGRPKPLRLRRALFNTGKLPRSSGIWRLKYTEQLPSTNDFFESEQSGEHILRALRKIHAKDVTKRPPQHIAKKIVGARSDSTKTSFVPPLGYFKKYYTAQDSNEYNYVPDTSRRLQSPEILLQPEDDYFNSYSTERESKNRRQIDNYNDKSGNYYTNVESNLSLSDDRENYIKSKTSDNPENNEMIWSEAVFKLCEMVEVKAEMEENKKMSFLMVPLQTRLTGVAHPVRVERSFLPTCSKWMQKSCSGESRFPLTKDCSYWTPIQTDENPGCPLLDHREMVDWRKYSPEKCPCKWPCTEEFDAVQECYVPHKKVRYQKAPKEETVTLDSRSVIQLCKAIAHGRGTGGSDVINVGWIPIQVQMDQKKLNPKSCFSHTYLPCANHEDNANATCGRWSIQKSSCNPSPMSNPRYYNSECPCKYPCTPFFNPINECEDSGRTKSEKYSTSSGSLIGCTFANYQVSCKILPESSKLMEY